MELDITRLHADLRALERRIRDIKPALRRPWTRSMAADQHALLELAAEATALYTLRAWSRGRLHRTHPPRDLVDSGRDLDVPLRWDAREHNRKLAERIAERYRADVAERDPPDSVASIAS